LAGSVWQVAVTTVFFFVAMMLAPTLGALIVIAIVAASRFRL
jgi:hypothetical protein